MKKSIFLIPALLGLAFTACDDTSDLGTMQVNNPPTVIAANGVATADLIGATLNLDNYANVNVPVMDVAMINSFPEGSTLSGTLQVASKEDFSDAVDVPYTSVAAEAPNSAAAALEGDLRFLTAEAEANLINNAFVKFYGNSPADNTLYFRYNTLIQNGTQYWIIKYKDAAGAESEWWPARMVTVTPINQRLNIAPSYNVFGPYIGNGTPEGGIVMEHDATKHEWDDPVFSAIIMVTEEQAAAGFKWQICPTGNTAQVWGPMEPEQMRGNIVEGGQPGVITEAGSYKIEVNMKTAAYTVNVASKTYYVPCTGNNNHFDRDCQQIITDGDYVNYYGLCYINGFWGLTNQPNFNDVNFFKGEGENTLARATGPLNDQNGCPQPDRVAGLYLLRVNLLAMTYTAERVASISMIGAFNEWKVDTEVNLKRSNTSGELWTVWTGEVTFTEENSGFLFRFNHEWDEPKGGKLGGSLDDLKLGGADLASPGPGTYDVRLDLSTMPWKVTFTKK